MERITMAHGSGGVSTGNLIGEIFAAELGNEYLSQMEDSTVVPAEGERLALTTDSFVVTPVEFPGGDIGRLSVCGTVNDLLMSGARPAYLTCGFILEEGLPIETLHRIVRSMADTAREAGVLVAAGDTKVVENHSGPDGGLIINTAGVGFLMPGQNKLAPSASGRETQCFCRAIWAITMRQSLAGGWDWKTAFKAIMHRWEKWCRPF